MSKTTPQWATRFIWSAIIQGALALVWTFIWFIYGSLFITPTPSRVIAAGSAGTWLLVGYIAYILMIIALGVTALFYHYLEVTLNKPLGGITSALGWIHLVLMNVGIIGATWLLMYAGYVGGAALLPKEVGGGGLTPRETHMILAPYPLTIVIFLIVGAIGVLAGGLTYILSWKGIIRK
jgi:hypothetical protein